MESRHLLDFPQDRLSLYNWHVHGGASPTLSLTRPQSDQTYRRPLAPTEASYAFAATDDGDAPGVNDMYLHIHFTAPAKLAFNGAFTQAWQQQLVAHPLLAARLARDAVSLDDQGELVGGALSFVCDTHLDTKAACAKRFAFYDDARTDQVRGDVLNGKRILSDDRLACLIISSPLSHGELAQRAGLASSQHQDDGTTEHDHLAEFDYWLLTTHFLGDGMALHTTANEFFKLVASASARSETTTTTTTLDQGRTPLDAANMPLPMESRLRRDFSPLQWAVAKGEYAHSYASKQVGAHAFKRARRGPRKTVVPTVRYSPEETQAMLTQCKSRAKVTVASALFALCALAYARLNDSREEPMDPSWPLMIYSALNTRAKDAALGGDHFHINISYYNIVLPAYSPTQLHARSNGVLWARAQSVQAQTRKIVRSPFKDARVLLTAFERGARSLKFARQDLAADLAKREIEQGKPEQLVGLGISGIDVEPQPAVVKPATPSKDAVARRDEQERTLGERAGHKSPSTALMGVSMLGNLDAMYEHGAYGDDIELQSLTTGSRQRAGALLLFGYTFRGQLTLCLGYDENGFAHGEIPAWWRHLLYGVDQHLLCKGTAQA